MRIVYISELIYPFSKGGAERQTYELGRRLVQSGHEIHWYGMMPRSELPPDGRLMGIHLHRVCEPDNLYASEGRRAIRPALRFTAQLGRCLLRDRSLLASAGVVDCSLYPFFSSLLVRALAPRARLVVTWHEFWGRYWLEYLGPAGVVGWAVERLTAAVATHIAPSSDRARRGLAAAGVAEHRMTTISNGVDTNAIDGIAAAGKGFDVVSFGRLKDHKNIDVLLRALKLLGDERPGTHALIIGSGPEEQALHDLSAELELENSVRFAGAVESYEEMISAVKSSTLFVHPSTKEGGASITVLEANACGVPVVAVRHPLGIDPCLIEEGVNGFWIDGLAPELLASRIAACLADGAMTGMRERSMAFARRYDWSVAATAFESLYARLVEAAGRDRVSVG